MSPGLSIGEAVAEVRKALAAAEMTQPALEARLLVAAASGLTRAQLLARDDQALPPAAAERLGQLLARRLDHEPFAYIVGHKEFWSLDFAVDRNTLIPRPDSETLVEAVLHWVEDRRQPLRLLDLGTGSGCLLLTLLQELPHAWGVGVDLSPGAIRVAAANAARLGVGGRACFVQGDWTSALAAKFDVIVGNPPYIAGKDRPSLAPEITQYEPELALFAGVDGLTAYRRILPDLNRVLADAGAIFLELGAGQASAVVDIAIGAGLQCSGIKDDLAGVARCLHLQPKRIPSPNKGLGNQVFPA